MRFRFVPPHIHTPRSVQSCDIFRIRRGTVLFRCTFIHGEVSKPDQVSNLGGGFGVHFRVAHRPHAGSQRHAGSTRVPASQPASQRRRWPASQSAPSVVTNGAATVPRRCRTTVPHGAARRCRTVPHGAARRCRTVPRRTEKHHSYTLKRSILLTVPHGAATFVKRKSIFLFSFFIAAPCGTVSKIERFKVYEWCFSVRRGTVAAPCGTVRHRAASWHRHHHHAQTSEFRPF